MPFLTFLTLWGLSPVQFFLPYMITHKKAVVPLPGRYTRNFIIIVLFALLVLAPLFMLTGCKGRKEENKPKTTGGRSLQAEAFIVKAAPLESVYQSSGTLLSNEEISVYPETPGRITAINFKEGSHIKKGDLLVQLFNADIQAQIQKLKAQRELAITTKGRQDELLAINGISRQEYDNTVTQVASIDADIAYNEAQLRRLQIHAPFDGIIGLRNVSLGAIVSSSTLITTIQQVHPLKLDFPVPDQYRSAVKVGAVFYFTVSGLRDTLKAKVAAIQPASDAVTRTVTIRGIAPNPDARLIPGAFANVYFPLSENTQAIVIPSQCIIPTTKDRQVAIVKGGKAELVTVTTGMRMVSDVEILHGLQPGDTVMTTGIMQVKPGMEVKITKVQ